MGSVRNSINCSCQCVPRYRVQDAIITKTTADVANKYINFIKSVFIGYLDTF
mgnify:CR=1 FL=1